MKKKIEDVLDQISEDVLTEDSKKMLSEAFEDAVQAAVSERVELQVKDTLQQLDEDHAVKLEQLLEAIDEDHTKKLVAVLEKVDADHTQKLEYLIKRNDKVIREDANVFKENLLNQISNYLELYVEKAIPRTELKEAVENKRAQKMVHQMKQVMALDDSFINNTIKEAVQDGRKTIDGLKSELNEAVKQNIRIQQDLKNRSAELVLEKSTVGLEKNKKQYVMRMLKGKDPEYITENINYVVKMFEKDADEQREVIVNDAKGKSKIITEKYDTAPRADKKAPASTGPSGEAVGGYLDSLKHQDGFRG